MIARPVIVDNFMVEAKRGIRCNGLDLHDTKAIASYIALLEDSILLLSKFNSNKDLDLDSIEVILKSMLFEENTEQTDVKDE